MRKNIENNMTWIEHVSNDGVFRKIGIINKQYITKQRQDNFLCRERKQTWKIKHSQDASKAKRTEGHRGKCN